MKDCTLHNSEPNDNQSAKTATPARPNPMGARTPGLNTSGAKFGGNKPKGEKHSSDGKGHFSGH
jgi:hypothetical protein